MKDLVRPSDIHWSERNIIDSVRFAVGAALVSDGFELLIPPRMRAVSERRHGGIRLDLDVVDTIVDRDRAGEGGSVQRYIASTEQRVAGDIQLCDDLGTRTRHDAPNSQARAEVQIRCNNLSRKIRAN